MAKKPKPENQAEVPVPTVRQTNRFPPTPPSPPPASQQASQPAPQADEEAGHDKASQAALPSPYPAGYVGAAHALAPDQYTAPDSYPISQEDLLSKVLNFLGRLPPDWTPPPA